MKKRLFAIVIATVMLSAATFSRPAPASAVLDSVMDRYYAAHCMEFRIGYSWITFFSWTDCSF